MTNVSFKVVKMSSSEVLPMPGQIASIPEGLTLAKPVDLCLEHRFRIIRSRTAAAIIRIVQLVTNHIVVIKNPGGK